MTELATSRNERRTFGTLGVACLGPGWTLAWLSEPPPRIPTTFTTSSMDMGRKEGAESCTHHFHVLDAGRWDVHDNGAPLAWAVDALQSCGAKGARASMCVLHASSMADCLMASWPAWSPHALHMHHILAPLAQGSTAQGCAIHAAGCLLAPCGAAQSLPPHARRTWGNRPRRSVMLCDDA